MKKNLILMFFCCFFSINMFAQNITNEEFTKEFSKAFCDCAEKDFKGYSKDFFKIWNYFKKEYQTKYKTNTNVLKEYLKKNQKEQDKFKILVEKMKNIGKPDACDLLFLKDKNLTNKELKSFLFNNFDTIKANLLNNKKCQNSFVLFNFISQISEE